MERSLDPSKDLPPFVSYCFDILQAGFRDTGEFVDPSTGVGHEAIKASLVQGSRVQSQNCKSKRVDIEPNVELRYSPRQQSEPECSKRSRCFKVYVGSSRSTRSSAAPSLRFAPLAINFPAVPDPEDSYPLARVVNAIDNLIIAHPNAPVIFGTR